MHTYDTPSRQFCNAEAPDTDLPTAIVNMCRIVDQHAAWLRDDRMLGVSPFEAASWALKFNEASGFAGSRQTPALTLEAETRRVPVASIVDRVLRNAQALSTLEAVAAGTAGRHRDAIRLLQTAADVYGYDWRDGWPG